LSGDNPNDFDTWVVHAVPNPARPLFREDRYLLAYLLAEEPRPRDAAASSAGYFVRG
jgi:hypothetical protein